MMKLLPKTLQLSHTWFRFPECCQDVKVAMTTEGVRTCMFTGVYPDGDVHWFNGDTQLNETDAAPQNMKRVDERGYLSINSSMPASGHTGGPNNCCLWHAESKTYSRCAPIQMAVSDSRSSASAMLEGSIWRFFIISVLLVTL